MVRRRRVIGVGLVVLAVVTLAALLAPLLSPYDPASLDVPARLRGPVWSHPFGTDEFGRDILSRTLFGARLSLTVGLAVTASATAAGIVVGLVCGTNPRADRVLMRVMDGIRAFPTTPLPTALRAPPGPGARTVTRALRSVYPPRAPRVARGA